MFVKIPNTYINHGLLSIKFLYPSIFGLHTQKKKRVVSTVYERQKGDQAF